MAKVISKRQEAEISLHNAYANFKKTGTSPLQKDDDGFCL
jgi:hypothetical protein